ncbi:MAG: ABC-F family ATP-binding cassette domain-containing protein [Actinomycetota bacterium]
MSTSSSSPAGRPFSLSARGLTVNRADRPVLVDVDVTLTERSRLAVVGPNGVGKSTLLRVIAGRLTPERGRLDAAPPDVTIGLLDQEPIGAAAGTPDGPDRAARDQAGTGEAAGPAGTAGTVRALIAERVGVTAAEASLARAADDLAAGHPDAAEGYDRALERYLAIGAADLDVRLDEVADRLGLASRLLDAEPATLSGGEAERVGLAQVMVSRFDLTLLDEPTNNLDLAGLDLLERWVIGHPGGLVIVSHDRSFLERTVTEVLEIDGHHHTAVRFAGGWEAYGRERERAAALARRRYDDYVDERGRLKARAQQQREWADRGVSRVRKRPPDNDKNIKAFRLAQTERLAGKAKATERAMERLEVVDKPWEPWRLQLTIERAPRSATVVAALDRAVFRRGSFRLGPIDLELRWAHRLALVGPNGSGKSTLLDGLLGRLDPAEGRATIGPGVIVGELAQGRDGLSRAHAARADGGPSVLQAVQDVTGSTIAQTRSLLAKFGLDAEAVARRPDSLSPGERTRAQLALFQARGVNLLVLDEPTNHLDLEAIEQLELALQTYDGTLIVVSHDRRFLEAVELTTTVDLGGDPGAELP